MTLKEHLTTDMREAMKSGDKLRLSTLRAVLGTIQTQEKSGKTAQDFNDEQVLSVLTKQVKQRRESAVIYTEANQPERAAAEMAEADIIESYLPTQLSADEVTALVEAEIAATGATTLRDMGKVVKGVLAKAEGRTDGKTVSTLVKSRLG